MSGHGICTTKTKLLLEPLITALTISGFSALFLWGGALRGWGGGCSVKHFLKLKRAKSATTMILLTGKFIPRNFTLRAEDSNNVG